MKSPGATTSGLMRPSYVGPNELKYASRLVRSVITLSSLMVRIWVAPTVRQFLALPGAITERRPSSPVLPPANKIMKSG